MQTVKQTHGDKTREKILNAGVELWPDVTLSAVARKLDMTHAAISYHVPFHLLKQKVAEHAVATGNSRVIVQLISEKDPAVAHLTPGERSAHLFSV